MRKSLGFVFTALCVLTCVLDVAWRAVGTLTLLQVSIGSGAFLAVVAFAPLFMKPSDASLNDIGIVEANDEEEEDEPMGRAASSAGAYARAGERVGRVA